MAIRDWSTTATGNASAASINWTEGQAPSTVNNSAREMMAQIRTEYTSERWGWVAQSGTASVASQTTVKVAGDITTDAVQYRKIKLTGGSTTVYANIVSSSYTSETTITLENATGSLSASHQVAWLAAIYDKNIPSDVLRGSSSTTFTQAVAFLESASFSASVHFTGPVEVKGAISVSGVAAFKESVSFSASVNFGEKAAFNSSASFSGSVNFLGAVNFTGGGVVSSATLSVAAGMLTVGGAAVAGGASGTSVLNNTAPTTAGATFSGSWSAYSAFEIAILHNFDPGLTTSSTTTLSVGVAVYSDGGTTPFLTGSIAKLLRSGTEDASTWTTVKIAGTGSTNVVVYPVSGFTASRGRQGFLAQPTATSSSGALYANAIRVWVADVGGTATFSANGRVIIIGS